MHEALWPNLMSGGKSLWKERRVGDQLINIKQTWFNIEQETAEGLNRTSKIMDLTRQSNILMSIMTSIKQSLVRETWPYVPAAARNALHNFFATTPRDLAQHKKFIDALGPRYTTFFTRLGFIEPTGAAEGDTYEAEAHRIAELEARVTMSKEALSKMQQEPFLFTALGALIHKDVAIIKLEARLEELKAAHSLRWPSADAGADPAFRLTALGLKDLREFANS